MFNLLTNYNYVILFLLLYNYNYILNNQRYIVLFNSTITKYLIIFISLIYLICHFTNDLFFTYSFNYNAIVYDREIWRTVSYIFFHETLIHLIFNIFELINIVDEEVYNKKKYIIKTLFFIVLNPVYELIIIKLIRIFNPYFQYFIFSIGYSGILYGFITCKLINLYGITYNTFKQIFITLILPCLIIYNTSILGHFVGILSGFTYILFIKYKLI